MEIDKGGRYLFIPLATILFFFVYKNTNIRSKLNSLDGLPLITFESDGKSFAQCQSNKNIAYWLSTPLAKDMPMAKRTSMKKCQGKEFWIRSWPSKHELAEDQRRDTACPYTLKNDTRQKIQRCT